MTLEKEAIQKFMKRLRKFTKQKRKPIKYYAVGEYGSTTRRPHYHIILFNSNYQDVEKAWKFGNIHFGKLTPASAAYTLKYVSKGKTVPAHKNDDRLPEFSLMSKKMGDNYITKKSKRWHKAKLEERYYLPLKDGKKIALPRYYKEKIYTKMQRDIIGARFKLDEIGEDIGKTPEMRLEESKRLLSFAERKSQQNLRDKRNEKL